MSYHPDSTHHAGTSAGGTSVYPSEMIPQYFPWRAAPCPHPVGFPATPNPDLAYVPQNEPPFTAPGEDATPLYPWRMHSDALKQVIRNLTLQVDSEVVEVRKETCGPNRSRITIVLETPVEI